MGHDLLVLGGPEAAIGVGQLGVAEEAGLSSPYREADVTGDSAVVVKEHQPRVALGCVPVQVNVVGEGVSRPGQTPVIGQLTAEQAIDAFSSVGEVHPHPGDDHQVGLTRFDHDPRGHMSLV